jgi:hypothetical protein
MDREIVLYVGSTINGRNPLENVFSILYCPAPNVPLGYLNSTTNICLATLTALLALETIRM